MTLPTASELDAWLAGSVAAADIQPSASIDAETYHATRRARHTLHFAVLQWLRAHNDAAMLSCPNLPQLERRYSEARTPDAKRDALRALLAARDTVVANAAEHAAVQAQAQAPLQLGLHPTGVGGEG